jgi:hypothetical protein
MMINTVEKIYSNVPVVEFTNTYKVTYSDNSSKICTPRPSKHRLPSNTRVDCRRKHGD